MRITTKGQVTIPLQVREQLGLLPNTEVDFRVEGNTVVMTKASMRSKGRRLIDHMRGRGTVRMSTDEIRVNVQMTTNVLASLLKKNWANISVIYVKGTMTPSNGCGRISACHTDKGLACV